MLIDDIFTLQEILNKERIFYDFKRDIEYHDYNYPILRVRDESGPQYIYNLYFKNDLIDLEYLLDDFFEKNLYFVNIIINYIGARPSITTSFYKMKKNTIITPYDIIIDSITISDLSKISEVDQELKNKFLELGEEESYDLLVGKVQRYQFKYI